MNKDFLERAYDLFIRKQPKDKFPGNCHPRTILAPNGYASPKLYSLSLFSELMLSLDKKEQADYERKYGAVFAFADAIDPGHMALSATLVRLLVPTYFPAEDFLRALAATVPPKDTSLADLEWPMEAMLFCLPLKFMKEYCGHEVPYLAVGRLKAGKFNVNRLELNNDAERLGLHFMAVHADGQFSDYSGHYSTSRKVEEVESSPFTTVDLNRDRVEEFERTSRFTPEEEQALNRKVNALAVKLVLALNARPELVEYDSMATPGKRAPNGETLREPTWHPNVIGRSYKIVRPEGYVPNGTHASPQMHWRRGHMRRQKCGQGRTLSKLIWIDPMLVNAPEPKEVKL